MTKCSRLGIGVTDDGVLQLDEIVFIQLARLVGLLEQVNETAGFVLAGGFVLNGVGVAGFVQVGPGQGAVEDVTR